MAGIDLNLSGAVRRTNKGSVDFYYGGGDEAWADLAAAYAGIPSVIRNGKVFGVITAGVISEFWWNDASQLANGDEVPYAQGGTTLTPDQVDAIDNANTPDAGNPFATMADIVSGTTYQGVWNANTNTPTLTSSVGTQGYYYVVNVDGSTDLNGITDWKSRDWAIFNGGTWQKVDNTENPLSIDITNANLDTAITNSAIQIGVKYRVTDCPQGVVWIWGIDANVVSTQAQLEGDWDGTTWTQGAFGSYDVASNTFTQATSVDKTGNVFVGGDNNTNTLATSTGNLFLLGAGVNDLTGSSTNYFGINCVYNVLIDSNYNHFGDNTEGIILNTAIRNVFGNDVKNLNTVNTDFSYCNVIGGLDFSAVDFTNAAQLFGRSNFWSINKVLGTDLIEVTFDSNLATSQTGQYDTSTDTFTPYGGTYTPTLTPDGSVCTAAALAADAIYSVSNGIMTIFISIDCTFDFTSNDATIDYTLPFGTTDVSGGNVTFNLNPNSTSLPISGYERNGQIHITTKDTAFNDDLTIYATITIKLA
jgi:hypothetical protein